MTDMIERVARALQDTLEERDARLGQTFSEKMARAAIEAMPDNLFVECTVCHGSGFSGRGTGYDDVCGECGGCKYLPWEKPLSPK